MPSSTLSLRDAKNHFSAVVQAASRGQPRVVTRNGKPVVVVVAAAEYERLRRLERYEPPSFTDHLLAMPTDGSAFDRLPGTLRETER